MLEGCDVAGNMSNIRLCLWLNHESNFPSYWPKLQARKESLFINSFELGTDLIANLASSVNITNSASPI